MRAHFQTLPVKSKPQTEPTAFFIAGELEHHFFSGDGGKCRYFHAELPGPVERFSRESDSPPIFISVTAEKMLQQAESKVVSQTADLSDSDESRSVGKAIPALTGGSAQSHILPPKALSLPSSKPRI